MGCRYDIDIDYLVLLFILWFLCEQVCTSHGHGVDGMSVI